MNEPLPIGETVLRLALALAALALAARMAVPGSYAGLGHAASPRPGAVLEW